MMTLISVAEMKGGDCGVVIQQRELIPSLNNRFSVVCVSLLSANEHSPSTTNAKVGPESTRLQCPQCKCIINTQVRVEASMQTHVVAAMLLP